MQQKHKEKERHGEQRQKKKWHWRSSKSNPNTNQVEGVGTEKIKGRVKRKVNAEMITKRHIKRGSPLRRNGVKNPRPPFQPSGVFPPALVKKVSFWRMAAARRRTEREDAVAWPRMSASFWAALLLASLLIAYCVGD
ncbi:hypothetical protein KOW79_016143 [Hemibagrus wyckioides]|uniref:Uncharacterized protein n=1 Tax=Hemibagrus wyckioides TaxID=337641 RepID=A0A9D3NDT1_9TELE|nr:hypothetical protein KOW79_016143 [Hemibagrus wyckioides]